MDAPFLFGTHLRVWRSHKARYICPTKCGRGSRHWVILFGEGQPELRVVDTEDMERATEFAAAMPDWTMRWGEDHLLASIMAQRAARNV